MPTPEVIAARIAALRTVQAGDVIVFAPAAGHVYTAQVSAPPYDSDTDSFLIPVAFEIRTYEGKFAGLTPSGYACSENLVDHESLRILRVGEGVI